MSSNGTEHQCYTHRVKFFSFILLLVGFCVCVCVCRYQYMQYHYEILMNDQNSYNSWTKTNYAKGINDLWQLKAKSNVLVHIRYIVTVIYAQSNMWTTNFETKFEASVPKRLQNFCRKLIFTIPLICFKPSNLLIFHILMVSTPKFVTKSSKSRFSQ